MSDKVDDSLSISSAATRTPGLMLTTLGFLAIFSSASFLSKDAGSLTTYASIGMGFLLAVGGLYLTFKEHRDQYKASGSLADDESHDLAHAVNQLSKNYEVLRAQATQGFILAGLFMALGILVILAGAVGEMFGLTEQSGQLAVVAGTVIEAVSGIGLYLFKQTFSRLNLTSDRLHDTWRVLAAFDKVETLPDDQKFEVVKKLITVLATPVPKSAPA